MGLAYNLHLTGTQFEPFGHHASKCLIKKAPHQFSKGVLYYR
jgi:hypothetical protein